MSFTTDRYLGRLYDPPRYDCWDLFREAWFDLTGDDVGDRTALRALRRRFVPAPAPSSPCLVLMRRGARATHVGLFYCGRVLHIQPEGARYERLADAARGFSEVRFYAALDADRRPAGFLDVGAA